MSSRKTETMEEALDDWRLGWTVFERGSLLEGGVRTPRTTTVLKAATTKRAKRTKKTARTRCSHLLLEKMENDKTEGRIKTPRFWRSAVKMKGVHGLLRIGIQKMGHVSGGRRENPPRREEPLAGKTRRMRKEARASRVAGVGEGQGGDVGTPFGLQYPITRRSCFW